MGVKVVLGIVIHGEDVEVVAVDLDISIKRHVSRCNPLEVLVKVLVLPSFEELTTDNA